MAHYLFKLDETYFTIDSGTLKLFNVIAHNTESYIINPSVLNSNGFNKSSVLNKSQFTFLFQNLSPPDLLVTSASDFQLSNWTSLGWGSTLADVRENYRAFIEANLITSGYALSINPGSYPLTTAMVFGSVGGTEYFAPVLLFSNRGSPGDWSILMATSGYMNSTSNAFGNPGSASFRTATESSSGANGRSVIGDGAGLYSSFFTKKNITQLALIDGSGSLDPASNANHLIYELEESTGEESIYDILLRLDTYLRDTSNFAGNDSFLANNFNAPSVLNITSGVNGYSGLLTSSGGSMFRTNTNQTPDKICIMGINADSDNDIQALCSYSGDLSTSSGKGDSWRGTNPSQTFWSYWGNDFHSNSQSQRIGSSWQTPPGVAVGVSGFSGFVYLLAK